MEERAVFRKSAVSNTIRGPGALASDSGSAMTNWSTFDKLLNCSEPSLLISKTGGITPLTSSSCECRVTYLADAHSLMVNGSACC